jgi:hypothetical protein
VSRLLVGVCWREVFLQNIGGVIYIEFSHFQFKTMILSTEVRKKWRELPPEPQAAIKKQFWLVFDQNDQKLTEYVEYLNPCDELIGGWLVEKIVAFWASSVQPLYRQAA